MLLSDGWYSLLQTFWKTHRVNLTDDDDGTVFLQLHITVEESFSRLSSMATAIIIIIRIYLRSELIWSRLSFNQIHPGLPNNWATVLHSLESKNRRSVQQQQIIIIIKWSFCYLYYTITLVNLLLQKNYLDSFSVVCNKECDSRAHFYLPTEGRLRSLLTQRYFTVGSCNTEYHDIL